MKKSHLFKIIFTLYLLILMSTQNLNTINVTTNKTAPGSLPIGTANYPIPSNAIYVSPSGNDNSKGTKDSPLKTVAMAFKKAVDGSVIVLRKGEYNEGAYTNILDEKVKVFPTPNKIGVTIQAYPNEAVYFDGSIPVTNWQKIGTVWVHNDWNVQFKHNPLYSIKIIEDDPRENWGNIDESNYPMAPYPDQVWINNVAQKQVKTKEEVSSGAFCIDYETKKIYLGDDPNGKEVRASNLSTAFSVVGKNTKILGIGFRRYATSVPEMGTVNVYADGFFIENCEFSDSATTGLSVSSKNSTIKNVTSRNNGMLGIHANTCNRLKADSLSIINNNTEHFNMGPISAGMKVTHAADITVSNSEFINNESNGLWFDEDCYNVNIVSNYFSKNNKGLVFELCSKSIIANNRFINNHVARYPENHSSGILVMSSDDVKIWNNSIVGSELPLQIKQDNTREPKKNRTWKLPEGVPNLTWKVDNINIMNNIIARPVKGKYGGVFSLQDSKKLGNEIGITSNGNVYHRTLASDNKTLIQWSLTKQNAKWLNFESLEDFKKSTNQDSKSIELTGYDPIDANGFASIDIQKKANTVAVAIPRDIASVSGLPAGKLIIGPIKNVE